MCSYSPLRTYVNSFNTLIVIISVFIPKLQWSGDVVLFEWTIMTSFDIFTWCFTSLTMVWLKAIHHLSSQSFQLMTLILKCPHSVFSHILPNTSIHAYFLLSLLPVPPSPRFYTSEAFLFSHLKDFRLARLLCWWLLSVLLIRTWMMMRLLALPLWPDTYTLCCPCLELSCSLPSLRS